MDKRSDVYTLIARLVNEWPGETASATLEQARNWLAQQETDDAHILARDTLASLDRLMHALQGGAAFDSLLNTREALTRYVNRQPSRDEGGLQVKFAPAGGVTLLRKGHHFTISDEELELVRDAVNTRKREIRKRQRRSP